jgi:protein-S-isoprenylcysteine O-methyltransferase Ste14
MLARELIGDRYRLQDARTRNRLIAGRIFGLGIAIILILGSNYWDFAHQSHQLIGTVLFLAGTLLTVLGFFGRLWCLSYIAGRKKKVLVTTGPYSLCRHPLYFFTLVGGLGLALCTETLSIPLFFLLGFTIHYPAIIRAEDEFLSLNFPDYDDYRKRVPMFFPRLTQPLSEETVLVNARHYLRELSSTAGFVCLLGVIELIEGLHHANVLPTYFLIP